MAAILEGYDTAAGTAFPVPSYNPDYLLILEPESTVLTLGAEPTVLTLGTESTILEVW